MPGYRKTKSKRKVSRRTKRKTSTKRKVSRKRTKSSSRSRAKISGLGKAGNQKAKVIAIANDPNMKFFGIPKGSNRPVAIAGGRVSNFDVKVTKNGLVRLQGRGPGGMKVFRGIGKK